MNYGDADPIAALATPPGESALAVIRISGNAAVTRLSDVFSRPKALREAPGNTVIYGWILEDRRKIDETLISVYRAPRSYTGEDSADISCHGGIAAVRGVLRVLRTAGFRDALPGEFTFRAFMNRKLDLTKAESVMELVSAKSDKGRERAVGRLSGQLEQEIQGIKSLATEVLAGAELFLDYSEDEFSADSDEAAGHLPQRSLAEAVLARLDALAASYTMERLYQAGALAVLAGRPNAGKSSLFNLLLKEDRAIVADKPGTTRDWIEAWISLEGLPIRLADTAGLRDAEDEIERLGVDRTRSLAEEADVILYVIDGLQGFTPEDRAFFQEHPDRVIGIWNKIDAAPRPENLCAGSPYKILGVSAKTGAGIPELSGAVIPLLTKSSPSASGPGIASERQKVLLEKARGCIREALALADQGQPLDVIAPALREAVNALGEITGEVSAPDILEVMFRKFCVGK